MARRTRRKKKTTRKTRRIGGSVSGMNEMPPAPGMNRMPPAPGMNNGSARADIPENKIPENNLIERAVLSYEDKSHWNDWGKAEEKGEPYIKKAIKNLDMNHKRIIIVNRLLVKLNKDTLSLDRRIQIEIEAVKKKLEGKRRPSGKKMDEYTINRDLLIEENKEVQHKIRKLKKELETLEQEIATADTEISKVEEKFDTRLDREVVGKTKNDSGLYAWMLSKARPYDKLKSAIKSDKEPIYDAKSIEEELVYSPSTQKFVAFKRTYDISTGVVKILFSKSSGSNELGSKRQSIMTRVESPYLFLVKALDVLNSHTPIHTWLSGYYHYIKNPQAVLRPHERSIFEKGFEFAKVMIQQGMNPLELHTVEVRINLSNDNLRTVNERFKHLLLETYTPAQFGPPSEEPRPWPIIAQTMTREIIKNMLSRQPMRNLYNVGKVPEGANNHDNAMLDALNIKMGIEASTRSNAVRFISIYCATSPMAEPLLFTEGLIRAMRDVHRVINERFQANLHYDRTVGHTGTKIVHSGGNLFGLISGIMLSFLLPPGDPSSFIEKIKARFKRINPQQYDTFMKKFMELIGSNPLVLVSLIETSVKVSDIDVLLMTNHEDIETLDSGFLQAANLACAKVLRDILADGLLPFPPNEPYTGRSFISFSGLSTEDFHEISGRGDVTKAAQTSNRIEIIKILLNRLKVIAAGGIQLGEFLDICIGSMENPTFREKLLRFLMDDYYTLDMLIDELEAILSKGEDDKSPVRQKRLALLKELKMIPGINDLFRIIGRAISNEDIDAPLQWEGTYDPEIDDP